MHKRKLLKISKSYGTVYIMKNNMEKSYKVKRNIKRLISNVFTILFLIILIYIYSSENKKLEKNEINNVSITNTINSIQAIPEYSGEICIDINNNIPFFTEDEMTEEVFETYSELDEFGRCGVAYANICVDLMPKEGEERDRLFYKPTGWHQKVYNGDEVLYNRCHLIAWQLGNENENINNLITGTSALNEAMNQFEMLVGNKVRAKYRKGNKIHVLYRVTPDFRGDNLVANGVLMEAKSVEDNGQSICFNKYIYNVQAGFEIDYLTGFSEQIIKN